MNEQQIPKLAGLLVEHQGEFKSLPTADAQWVIQHTIEAIGLFVEAVRNRAQQATHKVAGVAKSVKRTLIPWKTIKTGGTTTEKLLRSIEEEKGKKEKNEVSKWARDITTKPAFVIYDKPGQADLIIMTPADLGFTTNPRTDAFMTRKFCAEWSAKHLDGYVLELCEPEDGPQLRLQYQDQPPGEILWMAMERIADSDGYPYVFHVKRHDDGKRWLNAHWTYPSNTWSLDFVIVFRFRKLPSPSATSVAR